MILHETIRAYAEGCREEHLQLLKTLAQIPAPSGLEEQRAIFCRDWLLAQGGQDAYIDEALNVILPIGVTGEKPLVVFAAHSDVVFPDTEPLPLKEEDGKLCCPGVGDDTACVAALMMAAKYILREKLIPAECGLLLVIDSGEEGLGNLKGIRRLFADFEGRIREFISFDGQSCRCVDKAVGSRRFRIEVDTEGGHSYGAFGNKNAIAVLASLIDRLYGVKVPELGKTTYNVGTISGGTSVNSIAQHAEMLYEFRSDEREALAIMQENLDRILAEFRDNGNRVTVTPVGDPPCGAALDEEKMSALRVKAQEATIRCHGRELWYASGSTDCNIPLSLGIPAICVGCYEGAGSHTREEYVLLDSLTPGLEFAMDMIGQYL